MLSSAIHAAALAHACRLTNDHSETALLPLVDAYETGYHAATATPALGLSHTTDPAATYGVAAVIEPAAAGWLHLPTSYCRWPWPPATSA